MVRDGVATFRPVKVGIAGDEYFEVLDGLRDGETIVAGTYQAIRDLKDGAKVKQADSTQTQEGRRRVMSERHPHPRPGPRVRMGDGAHPRAPGRDASTSGATSTSRSWARRARASPP